MSDETAVAVAESPVPVAEETAAQPVKKKMSMVVMSGDMDRLFGALIIANGAAAMGMDVTMFFTFWGLRAIKKPLRTGKTLFGRMLGMMYGGDISKSHPSKFAFGGMGRWMFGKMMGAHNVATLAELRDMALSLGVKMYPCQMSMDVMEIPSETFIDGVQEPVGVGFFIGESQESQSTMFI